MGGSDSRVVHRFDRLDNLDGAGWWADVYRLGFDGYTGHTVIGDEDVQRDGIDHLVDCAAGRLRVDGKVRAHLWPDIALEVWSGKNRDVPGWVRRPDLETDFIAYVFLPAGVCHFLPFATTCALYEERKWEWSALGYPTVESFNTGPNGSWNAVSVAVPTAALLAALPDSWTVNFDPAAL